VPHGPHRHCRGGEELSSGTHPTAHRAGLGHRVRFTSGRRDDKLAAPPAVRTRGYHSWMGDEAGVGAPWRARSLARSKPFVGGRRARFASLSPRPRVASSKSSPARRTIVESRRSSSISRRHRSRARSALAPKRRARQRSRHAGTKRTRSCGRPDTICDEEPVTRAAKPAAHCFNR